MVNIPQNVGDQIKKLHTNSVGYGDSYKVSCRDSLESFKTKFFCDGHHLLAHITKGLVIKGLDECPKIDIL